MHLKLFKTLWGYKGPFAEAIAAAQNHGFDGIEAVPPGLEPSLEPGFEAAKKWRAMLDETDLGFIAEVPTAGDYVPRRDATANEHLDSLRQGLEAAKVLRARLVTCVGGCDAWSVTQSVDFFGRALHLARDYALPIAFETHRSRSLFTPWTTRELLTQLPEMQLTCDFSHWCVVLERLPDWEAESMDLCFARAAHVHARVGHAQGPQVADPRSPEYAKEVQTHEAWWRQIWQGQQGRGVPISTMTPEWGPDGYEPRWPGSAQPGIALPAVDLDEINIWMAKRQKGRFEEFSQGRKEIIHL